MTTNLEPIKSAVHSSKEFQTLLKKQAVSDAKHDLVDAFQDIYKEYTHIGTPLPKEKISPEADGWDIVTSFVEEWDSGKKVGKKDNVKTLWKIDRDSKGTIVKNEYNVKMKETNFIYKVKVIEIDGNTEKEADVFFETLAPGKKEILAIWDSSTGFFLDSLKGDAKESETEQKRFTFVINREVISDPACKPNPSSSEYSLKADKPIQFSFAFDMGKDAVSYPAWQKDRMDYRWDFFSDFDLHLTAIEYNEHKSTSLKFTDKEYTNESKINTSQTGKMANSKNAMIVLLKNIKDLLKKLMDKPSKEDKDYFVMLQKKRSGDSLMVLSYFDTGRLYEQKTEVPNPEEEKGKGKGKAKAKETLVETKKWQLATHLNPTENTLFLITHDTFNTLPISLANGANLIHCGAVFKEKKKDGSKETEVDKQYIYVFTLQTEPIDVVKEFFQEFQTNGEENSNKIVKLILDCGNIYEKNSSNLSLAFQKAVIEAMDQRNSFITSLEAATSRQETQRAKKTGGDLLNESLRNLYRKLYIFILYKEKYKPHTDFVSVKQFMKEILVAKSLTKDLREKVEQVRNTYILFLAKPYELITEGIQTEFEKEIAKNKVITEGIPYFTFIQEKGFFDLFKKHSRLLFGTIPLIITVMNNSPPNSVEIKAFVEFLVLLRDLQEKKIFNDASLKDSIELWNTMTLDFKLPSKDERILDSVDDPYPPPLKVELSISERDAKDKKKLAAAEAEQKKAQKAQAWEERVTILNECSATVIQEVAGVEITTIQKEMQVDTDTTADPYHKIIKDDTETNSEVIVKQTLKYLEELSNAYEKPSENTVLPKVSKKIPPIINALEQKEGGAKDEEERLNTLLFFRFVGINAFVIASHYDSSYPIMEQDTYNANLPFLASVIAFFLYKSQSITQFVLFCLQIIYYIDHGEEFEKEFEDIFSGSPYIRQFPAVFYEVLQLTFSKTTLAHLQKVAKKYSLYKNDIQNSIPTIPKHTIPSKEQMNVLLTAYLLDISQKIEASLLLLKQTQKEVPAVQTESDTSLLSMMSLPKVVRVKAGGSQKTRKVSRKSTK